MCILCTLQTKYLAGNILYCIMEDAIMASDSERQSRGVVVTDQDYEMHILDQSSSSYCYIKETG